MSKIKSTLKCKVSNWIIPNNKNKEVFSSGGKVKYCLVCEKSVSTENKSLLDHHCKRGMFSILRLYNNVTYILHIIPKILVCLF